MANVNDLKSKQTGWRRLEYKLVSRLSISIRFDYDNLEDSSVDTVNSDDGQTTFKLDYNEMNWIEEHINEAIDMKARSVRLSLEIFDGNIEKRCRVRH